MPQQLEKRSPITCRYRDGHLPQSGTVIHCSVRPQIEMQTLDQALQLEASALPQLLEQRQGVGEQPLLKGCAGDVVAETLAQQQRKIEADLSEL